MEACHNQKQNIVLWAHGELDASSGKEVENHLEVCESCRREWQRLLLLLEKLKTTAESPELSPQQVKSMVTSIKWQLNNRPKEKWWQRYAAYKPPRLVSAMAMACMLIIAIGIIGYAKLYDINWLKSLAGHQNEELLVSDKDLEIITNLEFLKEMDAIQKLSQVVDLNGEPKSPGEIDNDTRGMRQDAYRKIFV